MIHSTKKGQALVILVPGMISFRNFFDEIGIYVEVFKATEVHEAAKVLSPKAWKITSEDVKFVNLKDRENL